MKVGKARPRGMPSTPASDLCDEISQRSLSSTTLSRN